MLKVRPGSSRFLTAYLHSGEIAVRLRFLAFSHFTRRKSTLSQRAACSFSAQMLASTSHSVAQIVPEVGYESEVGFNYAFKRQFTVPPARFRSQSRSAHGPGSQVRPVKRKFAD